MTVFKYFLKLASRQRGVILLYLGIFILISLLTSSSMEKAPAGFATIKPTVKIIQEDHSALADRLAAYLRTQGIESELDLKEADAKEILFSGAVSSLIVIPETFSQDFAAGREAVRVYTDDRKMEAVLFNNTIQKYLMFLKADAKVHGAADPARIETALRTQAEVTINNTAAVNGFEAAAQWFRFYFNFISYVMLSILIMISGLIMSEFNDENIKRRNSIIPSSSTRFQLHMVAAQVLLALGIAAMFLVIGFVMKGTEAPGLNWAAHTQNAFTFALAALALSFLINSITRKTVVHTSLATVLSLGSAFISGVMVPIDFLNANVITLAKFFPTYYYVQATNLIMDGSGYLQSLGIQLLFALLFLVLGLTITKLRQGEDFFPVHSLSKAQKRIYT